MQVFIYYKICSFTFCVEYVPIKAINTYFIMKHFAAILLKNVFMKDPRWWTVLYQNVIAVREGNYKG